MKTARNNPVMIYLRPEQLAALDTLRGQQSRSEYLRELLVRAAKRAGESVEPNFSHGDRADLARK